MKAFLSFFLLISVNFLIIGGSYGCNPSNDAPSDLPFDNNNEQLKIVCYNIRYGELASLEEIAGFFKDQNADIVALQEVDVNTHREAAPHQNGKDFITELGYHSGMLTAYARTIYYSGGYYGIGILSKYPFKQTRKVLLPMTAGAREQRGMLLADVELPNGKMVTFVSTHLDHSTSEVRSAQVEVVNQTLMDNPYPVIIAGDFNADPESKEIKEGMKNWGRACPLEFTAPAKSPRVKIDYIFYYPTDKWNVIKSETPQIQMSDHLPVTAEMELID